MNQLLGTKYYIVVQSHKCWRIMVHGSSAHTARYATYETFNIVKRRIGQAL